MGALQEKSYAFSVRVVNLYKYLVSKNSEKALIIQLLRSGTSVGANVEEALGAQSDRDFASKLYIAYKEARETSYWIRLLKDTDYLTVEESSSILKDCDEILKLLGATLTTLKNKQKTK